MSNQEETIPTAPPITGPSKPEDRVGTVVGGRYRLHSVLGSGGMGTVYEAEHTGLGKRFALKLLRSGLAPDAQQGSRFIREARVLARLHHPHIVEVSDFGVTEQELYLVMEFLAGQSLSAWLVQQPSLPSFEVIAALLDQTLDAIETMHAAGILHRDLKPENLLLLDTPAGLQIKVIDLGLAYVNDPADPAGRLTSSGMVAGTPRYMSPEQCRSLSVGQPSDLYAIGCILTEMLQGTPPFVASSPAETMAQHMLLAPPPLVRPPAAPPVPDPLEQLRLALLAKMPEQRPASATDVRRLLREALSPAGGRRGDDPGDRSTRAPRWDHSASPDEPSAASAEGPLVIRLGDATGSDDATALALALQGMRFERAASLDDACRRSPAVLLVDVGQDDDAALSLLQRASTTPLRERVVILRQAPTIVAINLLVAAGAADVLSSSSSPDALVKRVRRLLRAP